MFDWASLVARELREGVLDLYWMLLATVVLVVIILELFKLGEERLNPEDLLRRILVSILMVWSFDEVINTLGSLTEGITEKIGGADYKNTLLTEINKTFHSQAPSLFKFRQMFLYAVNLGAYFVAYLGYSVTDILIHFSYTILYILSPLLILAYVPRSTAFITANLYKGLLHVSSWKIMWHLLGILLLRLLTVSGGLGFGGLFGLALMNICVGFCMLTIPFFVKSLLADGLTSMASKAVAGTTGGISQRMLGITPTMATAVGREVFTGFRGTRNFTGRQIQRFQNGAKKFQELQNKRKLESFKQRTVKTTQKRLTKNEEKNYEEQNRRGTKRRSDSYKSALGTSSSVKSNRRHRRNKEEGQQDLPLGTGNSR